MSQTFMGIKLSQRWEDLGLWEQFFEENPIKTFIELGTGIGGMSLYFALQCRQRNIIFHTYDNQKFMDFETGLSKEIDLKSHFHFVDLFSEETQFHLATLIQDSPHPLVIFFDNGDKAREWKLYAPFTPPGDFCAVHDFGAEFFLKDIGGVKVEHILGDIKTEPFAFRTAWFKRV